MRARFFLKSLSVAAVSIAAILFFIYPGSVCACGNAAAQNEVTQGTLQVVAPNGAPKAVCPLKHTDVKAEISGFLSRVVVTQEFENPFSEKIEAVYTFPLPQNAAVDDMTMLVSDRTVRGKILRREEAQAVYEAAKSNGQTASLLNQERPNIFTQSVANILPGEQIKISISYVETLKYEDGSYEFVFPYDVAGNKFSDALLTHSSANGGFFTLILQPPERVTAEDVTPKELVFVLDTSGSMSGFPIEKAKETMKLALDNLYPYDTFNLITFSGDEHILFPEPVSATPENL